MIAILLDNGKLEIRAENINESYILETWVDKNHNKKITECIKVNINWKQLKNT